MEIIQGWTHRAFPVDDASRVGEARRFAAGAAVEAGLDEVQAGRLALVVTELGTNLHRHARGGQLLIAARPGLGDVEVIAIDKGPGMSDVAQSMCDGYSTGSGSPGTGLGAVRRLADDFDLYSTPAAAGVAGGTVCVARVARAGRDLPAGMRFGAVSVCAPGETANGDGWALALDGAQASLLVADGLGHGPEAAKASGAAREAFARQPFADSAVQLGDLHTALQTTRGAAVCCLRMDAGQVRCAGAGNVIARIVSGLADRTLLTQHGTVGVQMRRVQEQALALPPYAQAVVYSDGIESRWDPAGIRPLLGRDPTLIAALLLRDHTRVRDDATVVVLGRPD